MPDLVNCPSCGKIMVRNQFRDMCQECYIEEEKLFEIVYKYMRKRVNRTATMTQVVEATEVPEELILKFIKSGRIRVTEFPNLGFPCEKCGSIIQKGKLCDRCVSRLKSEIAQHEEEEARKEELQRRELERTYYSKNSRE